MESLSDSEIFKGLKISSGAYLHFTMMGKNKPKPAWKVFSICVQLETVGNINPLIWYGHVEIKKNEFKIIIH
jgi:hypothetical protein